MTTPEPGTGRIRWIDSPDTSTTAFIGWTGSIHESQFAIYKPDQDGDRMLASQLPGLDEKRSYDADPDALKAEAERWLSEFVSSLGASFPDALRQAATEELTLRREAIGKEPDCERLNRAMGWAEAMSWVLAILGHATPDEPAKEAGQ